MSILLPLSGTPFLLLEQKGDYWWQWVFLQFLISWKVGIGKKRDMNNLQSLVTYEMILSNRSSKKFFVSNAMFTLDNSSNINLKIHEHWNSHHIQITLNVCIGISKNKSLICNIWIYDNSSLYIRFHTHFCFLLSNPTIPYFKHSVLTRQVLWVLFLY